MSARNVSCLMAAALAVLANGAMVSAAPVVVPTLPSDSVWRYSTVPATLGKAKLENLTGDQDSSFAGDWYGNSGFTAVYQLPTLGAGETFSSVAVNFKLRGNNPVSNATLYFGGVYDSLGVNNSILNGAAPMALQTDFMTPADGAKVPGPGWDYIVKNSSAAGNAALLAALNGATATALDGSAAVGPDRYLYVMLGYDPVAPAGSNQRYQVLSIETGAGNASKLTYETAAVPEPASLGLIGLGAIALLGRKRNR